MCSVYALKSDCLRLWFECEPENGSHIRNSIWFHEFMIGVCWIKWIAVLSKQQSTDSSSNRIPSRVHRACNELAHDATNTKHKTVGWCQLTCFVCEQMKAFSTKNEETITRSNPMRDYAIFVHSTRNEKKKKKRKGKKEIALFSGRHSAVRRKFHLCQQWRRPADDRNNLNEFNETHLWPTFQFSSIWMLLLIRLVRFDVLGRSIQTPFLWRRFHSTIIRYTI